ncbi:MAG: NUDIX hydrolase [Patescibacteria group bacterium]
MEKIGVSQKAIILNKEGKFLALRRSKTAPAKPLSWDLPGGELDFGEDPIKGIIREIKEETGITIKKIEPFDVEAHIATNKEFWVTIAYKTQCDEADVKLSFEHDEFKWLLPEEFLELESSEKLQRFAKKLT